MEFVWLENQKKAFFPLVSWKSQQMKKSDLSDSCTEPFTFKTSTILRPTDLRQNRSTSDKRTRGSVSDALRPGDRHEWRMGTNDPNALEIFFYKLEIGLLHRLICIRRSLLISAIGLDIRPGNERK